MALPYQNNNVGAAIADLVPALAGRRINLKGIDLSNGDTVQHTVILYRGAVEFYRVVLGAGASRSLAFAGEFGEKGTLVAAGSAVRVATAAAATASTVFAFADAGRV